MHSWRFGHLRLKMKALNTVSFSYYQTFIKEIYLSDKAQSTIRHTFTIHLYSPTLTIVMLYGVIAPKHVPTNCKSCKIEQHGLLLGLITLSDHQMY